MNKFHMINAVTISDLGAQDKCLLIELVMRADKGGVCWPSVQRLCMARGIKHEKNFKGADAYLPGLVTKAKRGRRNIYKIDVEAVMRLAPKQVVIKHTPSFEGPLAPSEAEDTPAVSVDDPSDRGANSSSNSSVDSSKESSDAPTAQVETGVTPPSPASFAVVHDGTSLFEESQPERCPSQAGVSEEDVVMANIAAIGTGRPRTRLPMAAGEGW